MRKDSQIIFALSIVLTLGIVGGAQYLYLQGQKRPVKTDTALPEIVTGADQAGKTIPQPGERRTIRRTATPIKCTKTDGTVFWTNATHCQDADLNNRLSYADAVKPVPRVKIKRTISVKNTSSGKLASNNKSVKPIPREMPFACSFPIGMARKIETKSLRLKKNPADSIWKDEYCKWVCEARRKGCESVGEYLEYGRLCPRRAFVNHLLCTD